MASERYLGLWARVGLAALVQVLVALLQLAPQLVLRPEVDDHGDGVRARRDGRPPVRVEPVLLRAGALLMRLDREECLLVIVEPLLFIGVDDGRRVLLTASRRAHLAQDVVDHLDPLPR